MYSITIAYDPNNADKALKHALRQTKKGFEMVEHTEPTKAVKIGWIVLIKSK
jgi:hypothetical protein